jgi:glycosyltransferase involved in cell wall biosynthesis
MLSLSMIVKNEERCIIRCLDSVKEVVEEMVIVDTGSTDRTKELIEKFKKDHPEIYIKLLDFEWCDDFSKARNFALSHVTGKYVFQLDADEYLDPNSISECNRVKEMLSSSDKCYVVDVVLNNWFNHEYKFSEPIGQRIFPKCKEVYYTRAIHESIMESLKFIDYHVIRSSMALNHDGNDPAVVDVAAKKIQYINMLQKMYNENSNDIQSLFLFAREYCYFDMEKGMKFLKIAERQAVGEYAWLKPWVSQTIQDFSVGG